LFVFFVFALDSGNVTGSDESDIEEAFNKPQILRFQILKNRYASVMRVHIHFHRQ
jgi:hypothetical protein